MYKSKYKKASSRIGRRNKWKHRWKMFLFLSVPIALLAGSIFCLRADFMQIKKIEVFGNVVINGGEVKEIVVQSISGKYFFIIPRSNMLFFDEKELSSKILTEFKRAENVEVTSDVDGSLTINLKERVGEYLWCSYDGKCFLMSSDGLIFVEALREESFGRLTFRGGVEGEPITKHFADSGRMQNYLEAVKTLNDADLAVNTVDKELEDKAVFHTKLGNIFLNPEEDMSLSAKNAILLIEETKAKDPSATFDYIDARFGNKMFYKLK